MFISGSADVYSKGWNESDANSFTSSLAKRLIENDFKIVSGFGKGIGSSVVNGALQEIYATKYRHMDEHLCLRPFPQNIPDNERKDIFTKYRKDMISEAGVALFIFGNKDIKDKNGKNINIKADGCIEEYQIAAENGCGIVPIACTGFVAEDIYNEMKKEKEKYPYLRGYWGKLQNRKNQDELVDSIIEVLKKYRDK